MGHSKKAVTDSKGRGRRKHNGLPASGLMGHRGVRGERDSAKWPERSGGGGETRFKVTVI